MKDFKLQNHTPRNPYRVPDGYFDSLTQRVMSQLPETTATAETATQPSRVAIATKPRRRWIGWSVAAAACVGAFLMLTNLPAQHESAAPQRQTASVASTSASSYDENYEREVLEYAMVDDNDIYAYMSGDM